MCFVSSCCPTWRHVQAAADAGVKQFVFLSVHDFKVPGFVSRVGYFNGKRRTERLIGELFGSKVKQLPPGGGARVGDWCEVAVRTLARFSWRQHDDSVPAGIGKVRLERNMEHGTTSPLFVPEETHAIYVETLHRHQSQENIHACPPTQMSPVL